MPSAVVQIPDAASAGFEQHLHGPAFQKENLIKTFLAHSVSIAVKKKKKGPYFPPSLSGRRYSIYMNPKMFRATKKREVCIIPGFSVLCFHYGSLFTF